MKNKRPHIELETAEKVQKHANAHHNGNFTEAVNSLINRGLRFQADHMKRQLAFNEAFLSFELEDERVGVCDGPNTSPFGPNTNPFGPRPFWPHFSSR